MSLGRYILCIFIVGYISVTVQAQNCENLDGNAVHSPDCSGKKNCTTTKTCNTGFTSDVHNTTIKCENGYWKYDIECLACTSPSFGYNCANEIGQCSSTCEYNSTYGCQREGDGGPACDLRDAKLSITEEAVEVTALLTESVTITATINADKEDIILYKVLKMSDKQVVPINDELASSDGFSFSFSHSTSFGDESYNITVETTYEKTSKTVSVTVYEPVSVSIYKYVDRQKNEILEDSQSVNKKVEWHCEANGSPQPSANWTFNGIPVNDIAIEEKIYQEKTMAGNTAVSILRIRPKNGVSKKESGVYVCKGENSDNANTYNDIASVTLTVTDGTEVEYAKQKSVIIIAAVLGILTGIGIIIIAAAIVFRCRRKDARKNIGGEPNQLNSQPGESRPRGDSDYEASESHPAELKRRGKSPHPNMATSPQKRNSPTSREDRKSYHNPAFGSGDNTKYRENWQKQSEYDNSIFPNGQYKNDSRDCNGGEDYYNYDTEDQGDDCSEPHIYEPAISGSS